MTKFFEDKACTQLLLQIILDRKDLKVRQVHTQYDLKNLQGRSVRLDILATDHDGHVYNIEIQRDNSGAIPKRARYNSSLLDANVTEPGETLENLAETYVIFITENDVNNRGLPIYHIERMITETNDLFNDEAHIIYVNSQIKDETALGKLMYDLYCTNADEMHYKIFVNRARYLKQDEKGVSIMSETMSEIMREIVEEDRAEQLLRHVKNLMVSLGLSIEQAMNALKVSDKEREALLKNF